MTLRLCSETGLNTHTVVMPPLSRARKYMNKYHSQMIGQSFGMTHILCWTFNQSEKSTSVVFWYQPQTPSVYWH